MAESTDTEVWWRADVENVFIKIEMAVKSELDLVYTNESDVSDVPASDG